MNKRHHRYMSVWLAIMGSVVAMQSLAQRMGRVAPEKVAKISSSLDKRLLPEGAANLEVERSQVVAAPGITLVPVRFQAEDKRDGDGPPTMEGPPRKKFECGMYQLADNAPAKFLLVFGAGHTELEECGGLQAIGAATPRTKHGHLILIYNASTLHYEFPEPVILSWDDSQKQYVVNDNLTDFVNTQGKSYTVSNIRSLLASRAGKP